MDWTEPAHLQAAALCLLACAALGWFVPALIAWVPEPDPEPELAEAPEQERVSAVAGSGKGRASPPRPPKPLYADIAATDGLGLRTVMASAVCGALVGAGTGWAWALLYLVPLVPIGVALTVIDWRTTLLPTRIIAPTYGVVVVLIVVAALLEQDHEPLVRAGLGWLTMGGLYLVLWIVHPAGMGYGDVRLSGVLGLALGYLGWSELLVGAYSAFLIGGIGGGLLVLMKLVERKHYPFGPFMLFGALLGVAVGPALMSSLG